MSEVTEKIKERLGIVDVVGPYIKLEKAGASYKARCPFHHEKTPSFFVSPARNSYYCFGCGEKGDIFSFVQHFEGLDFMGALRVLGGRAGVEVVAENPQKREARENIFSALEEANRFFEANLQTNKEALKYLQDRGISEKTIKHFRIGYAPNEWSRTMTYLRSKDISNATLLKAGIIKESEDESNKKDDTRRYYDRFRGRIMFPLSDSSGRIIAFSGRLFPIDPQKEAAKYINSPETEVFNKSQVLYGFDKAKMAIRKFNFSIVVEGQVDLIMSHQAGFTNTVAISGTAFSLDHVTLLNRLSQNIVFAFDSDSAGIVSAGKSAEVALSLGMDVKVAHLPKGVDPADLAKKGDEHLKKAIRESVHIVDFYLSIIKEEENDERKRGKKVEETVLPFIARIKSNIDKEHFIAKVARFLNASEEAIRKEVYEIPEVETKDETNVFSDDKETKSTRIDMIKKQLLGILLWQEGLDKPMIDIKKTKKQIEDSLGSDALKDLKEIEVGARQEAVFMAEADYIGGDALKEDIDDLVKNLQIETLKGDYEKALVALREAESNKLEALVSKQLKRCKKLSEKLHTLISSNSEANT